MKYIFLIKNIYNFTFLTAQFHAYFSLILSYFLNLFFKAYFQRQNFHTWNSLPPNMHIFSLYLWSTFLELLFAQIYAQFHAYFSSHPYFFSPPFQGIFKSGIFTYIIFRQNNLRKSCEGTVKYANIQKNRIKMNFSWSTENFQNVALKTCLFWWIKYFFLIKNIAKLICIFNLRKYTFLELFFAQIYPQIHAQFSSLIFPQPLFFTAYFLELILMLAIFLDQKWKMEVWK